MPHRFIPPLPTDGVVSANDSASTTAAPAIDPTHTLAIKRWTKEILRLDDNAVIHVSEVACIDAGCPLVETAVTVFASSPALGLAPVASTTTSATAHENTPLTHAPAETRRTWTFTRPRVAVTKMMLQQTLATPPR